MTRHAMTGCMCDAGGMCECARGATMRTPRAAASIDDRTCDVRMCVCVGLNTELMICDCDDIIIVNVSSYVSAVI